MPPPYAVVRLDSKLLVSSHVYTRNGVMDAAMPSESNTDLELPAMKQPSETYLWK